MIIADLDWKRNGAWLVSPGVPWCAEGHYVQILGKVTLGEGVTLGDRVTLGDYVTLGGKVTSQQINEDLRAAYAASAPKHRFTKWVTRDRYSPNFDGGTKLHYAQGAVISVPDATVSDQQCAPGLHVLRLGHRPEWYGLCGANHDYIPLTVEVKSEDILFAGLPTMDGKLRVRELVVLD